MGPHSGCAKKNPARGKGHRYARPVNQVILAESSDWPHGKIKIKQISNQNLHIHVNRIKQGVGTADS